MSMVNDEKVAKPKSLGAETLSLVGNLVTIAGQLLFIAFQFVALMMGIVGAMLMGICRGASNHHRRR